MRKIITLAVIVLAAGAVRGEDAYQPEPKGAAEFRAAWRAFAGGAKGPEALRSLEARQLARLAAIPHAEAAVAADPKKPDYGAGLGYIYLSSGKYQQAKDAIDQAIGLKRNDPLLYLLRGQAEAALAYMEPDTAGERIGPALAAFDEAARLDPTNSLASLQAASVAFDVGRDDLAVPRVKQALERRRLILYRLPVPGGLDEDPRVSLEMWQYVQVWQWVEMVARCQNVVKAWVKFGEEREKAEDPDGAERYFGELLELGRTLGSAEPNLSITVSAGMTIMAEAYSRLLRLGEAKGDAEAEQWRGELGVLELGRRELYGAIQVLSKRLENDPPKSVEELLSLEAECVRRAMMGVTMRPQSAEKPATANSQERPLLSAE